MTEIIILSLIQGVTEFLPISSSSHLILMSELFNFAEKSLVIDVSLHIGSFFAVIIYFYKEILNFFKNKELFFKILIASVPVMLFGYILVLTDTINYLRNVKLIGFTTLLFGILLFISDRNNQNKQIQKDFNNKSAIIIGFYQILSLVPGVSRSGIAITGARFLGFNRIDSLKISFLLAIPTLAIVTIFGLKEIFFSDNLRLSQLSIFSIMLSFIFSYLTIKLFFNFIQKFNMSIFAFYRVILGIILIFISYSQN